MRYDRKVIVRAAVRTPDGGGGYTETLQDVGVWWAQVTPLRGTERIQAAQTDMRNPHLFLGNYRRSITGATELFYDDRRFDVESVVDVEAQHRQMEILADEIPV